MTTAIGRTGTWGRKAALAAALAIQACSAGAGGAGASDAVAGDPGGDAIADSPRGDGHVVMLVTGTSIVAAFFDVMDQRLKEQGFRTIVYQPEDQFTGPLEQGAAGIAEAVKAAIAQTGATKIDILAECNGGVASRFFVEQLGGDAYVDRLVTFVSAHHGTEWAKLGLNPALRDITPGSPFLAKLNSREGVPTATRETSVYICTDEIMKPYTTSRVAGALNVAVCDPELDRRTAERTPYDVKDDMGNALIKNYPIHLTGFWDEQFYRLLVSCLIDSEEDVRRFDGLAVAFE